MSIPRFEILAGTVNGINTVFTTSVPYTAGTLAAFLNGQLKRPSGAGVEDGFAETNPATGTVTFDEAPQTADVVQAFYLDTTPTSLETEVSPLFGYIFAVDDLSGSLEAVDELFASAHDVERLGGTIADDDLTGAVSDRENLSGSLECL